MQRRAKALQRFPDPMGVFAGGPDPQVESKSAAHMTMGGNRVGPAIRNSASAADNSRIISTK